MKLGFAGLGLMGAPMARNLLSVSPGLAVYNRSPEPRERLRDAGARDYSDPSPFLEACDAVILMLANDAAVDAVLGRGSNGFRGRITGKLIVNMGTHAPLWSQNLAAEIAAAGGRFVEAPVSGSAAAAEAAGLVGMVAGTPEDVELVTPVLRAMCRDIVPTGPVSTALACKLAVNLYLIASVAALAEAASLADRVGVQPAAFARVIGGGPLASEVAREKLGKMTSRDFSPQASIRDVCKNAALVAAAAAASGVNAGLLTIARQRFEAVLEQGGGELDMAAVISAGEGHDASHA